MTQKTSTAKNKFWLCQLLKTSTARKKFWLCRLLKTSTAKNFSTNHSQVRRSIANQNRFAQQIEISEFLSSDLKMEVTQIIRDEYGFDSNDDNEFMHIGRQYIC